jgi:hypothetical protein
LLLPGTLGTGVLLPLPNPYSLNASFHAAGIPAILFYPIPPELSAAVFPVKTLVVEGF